MEERRQILQLIIVLINTANIILDCCLEIYSNVKYLLEHENLYSVITLKFYTSYLFTNYV